MRLQIINLFNALFTDEQGVSKKACTEAKFMLHYSTEFTTHERRTILELIEERNGRFFFKGMKFYKPQ